MSKRPIHDVSTAAGKRRDSSDSSEPAPDLVPALTIASHPLPKRVGERLLLSALAAGKEVALSRNAPDFAAPDRALGSPIADPFVSRKPVRFAPAPRDPDPGCDKGPRVEQWRCPHLRAGAHHPRLPAGVPMLPVDHAATLQAGPLAVSGIDQVVVSSRDRAGNGGSAGQRDAGVAAESIRAGRARLRSSASIRDHTLRAATWGRHWRRGSRLPGTARHDWRSTARRPSTLVPARWRSAAAAASAAATSRRSAARNASGSPNSGGTTSRRVTASGMAPSGRKKWRGRVVCKGRAVSNAVSPLTPGHWCARSTRWSLTGLLTA